MKFRTTADGRYEILPRGTPISDPHLAPRLVELRDRDQYAADALEDRSYKFAKWLQGAVLGNPEAARYCRDEKIPMAKAQSENINEAGGAVVPEELAQDIVTLREAYGVFRRNARRWPLQFGGNSFIPRRSNGASAQWTAEGQSLTETAISYDSAKLVMRKLAAMMRASTELAEDALSAWGAFVAQEFAWAFAKAEDDAAFLGDGTSKYSGIVGLSSALTNGSHAGKITAASGHNAFGLLDAADIGAMLGALPARALPNAKIYCSVAGYGNTFVRLGASSGGLVATVDDNGHVVANFLGFPIQLVPSLPSSTGNVSGQMMVAAGDLRGAALGERRQITVRRLAERFAEIDQVAFVATERIDINVHDVGDANNAGALVGLFAP